MRGTNLRFRLAVAGCQSLASQSAAVHMAWFILHGVVLGRTKMQAMVTFTKFWCHMRQPVV